jgi:hypothetical protein
MLKILLSRMGVLSVHYMRQIPAKVLEGKKKKPPRRGRLSLRGFEREQGGF